MDARQADPIDPLTIARDRVRTGPSPDWLIPCLYNQDFRAKIRRPITHLLIERQVHAELRQIHFHQAGRLETMQAVQHSSQWRIEFEPQTQSLTLHFLKVRRGSVEIEHLSLGRIQFLRREAGLEGCQIDGWITLLMLLEDVIVGDILEWAYTLEQRPRLMSDYVETLFALPPGAEIGKHLFSVRYSENRPIKWRSSSSVLAPSITAEGDQIRCCWSGEATASPEPEESVPGWQLDFPWMQISDCPDWGTIAREVAKAWNEDAQGEGLTRLIGEITSSTPDLLGRVNRAIEMVQDSFRYLIVDIGFGGQIPASSESIIRRRYGDCKNLAFLLARLLRGLGIQARPVLVNALWRKSISRLLPSLSAFNHAIVEYEVEGQTRWVDATIRFQGGGALGRFVPDFGLGLLVDPHASGLITVPKDSLPKGEYELRESFLLDTAGHPSNLALVVVAKGFYADQLRREFESKSIEALAKERLQSCANRFARAGRLGPLLHHDDRDRNEFMLAEAFEISGFLKNEGVPDFCLFEFFSFATAGLLPRPSRNPRRNPFALPFPCRQSHIIEIEFPGMDPPNPPPFRVGNEFFSFARRSKSLLNYFKATFSLETFADSVAPAGLDKLRKEVENTWEASSFRVRLPVGHMKPRRRRDFGSLPPPSRSASRAVPARHEPTQPVSVPADALEGVPLTTPSSPNKSAVGSPTPAGKPAFIDPIPASTATPQDSAYGYVDYVRLPQPSRKHGVNRKCVVALWLLAGGAVGFILSLLLAHTRDLAAYGAVIFLLAITAEIWALVLAIVGLIECVREPDRYPRGKASGFIALVAGGFLGCLLLIALIGGVRGVIRTRSRMARVGGEVLKFAAANFNFHSPAPPWEQTDARRFGSSTLVAFVRPGPIFFTVVAHRLEPGYANPRARIVDLSKRDDRRVCTSYRLVSEQEADRNGLDGWQTESETVFQGHEYYVVRWILATNGFGYALTTWSQPDLKNKVKDEAERLCANFEPTADPPK